MKVLVGCEESGRVRRAFRGYGFDAWSCDLETARDGSEFHIKADILWAIGMEEWDLIILHPPCDYLAVSGNRWYGKGGRDEHMRAEAIEWTRELWFAACHACDHVALENPVSVIFQHIYHDHLQYVQPHEFGHPQMKATGFALVGLPPLQPTDRLNVPKKGTPEYVEWQKVWRMPPGPNRKRDRSITFLGIADAMADQWGSYVRASKRTDL